MNSKKQKLILEYMVSSPDIFALCSSIIKPNYFDPEFRQAVKFVKEYYGNHNAIPDVDQISAETDVDVVQRTMTRDQFQYCCQEIEAFCKQSAMTEAVLAAPELIEKGEFGKLESNIKEAVTVSLNKNLGVDFFADAKAVLQGQLTQGATISTGWADVDEVLFGGLQRGTLNLFSAGSGGGKSITMQNLGLNLAMQGLNVLYISLELSEALLAERLAYLLTGVGKKEMREKFDQMIFGIGDFEAKNTPGKFFFKYMPAGSNVNQFRAYLKEYELVHGHTPDVIIVDYLDLMAPIDKVSADNVFEKDKRVSEELRNLGGVQEYNAIIISASQLNRSAVKADEINHSHIAGGISKINTADVYITIIFSEAMRAAGEIAFNYQKTRNSDGVGKTTFLKWVQTHMRILTKDSNSSSLINTSSIQKPPQQPHAIEKRGKAKLASLFEDE